MTLGAGVTHSSFQVVGYTDWLSELFMILVRGLASSTEHSCLILSGMSIGSVERVFLIRFSRK